MKLAKAFEGLDLANAKVPTGAFTFVKSPVIFKLTSGLILFESDLDVDCDGRWPHRGQDPDARDDTSLHDDEDRPLDASLTPFFVLPEWFGDKHGILRGDYAAITWRSRLAFGILGDYGPKRKLGEASLWIHDALGNSNFVGGRYLNIGIDAGVQTLAFPGSRDTDNLVPDAKTIQTRGQELLQKALNQPRPKIAMEGRADQWGDENGETAVLDGGRRRVPLRQFTAWAVQTPPSQINAQWDAVTKKATLNGNAVPSAKRVGEEPVTALAVEIMNILGFKPAPGANEILALFVKK